MKLVASYSTSEQISEDTWRTFRRVGIFDETATLKDVYDWAKPTRIRGDYAMEGIELSEDTGDSMSASAGM